MLCMLTLQKVRNKFYKVLVMSQKRSSSEHTNQANKKMKPGNKFWALGLLDSMNDPDLQVKSDNQIVIIKDKYPKATFHYLVIPKEDISNLKKLTSKHVDLLKHMKKAADKLIDTDEHKKFKFKFGYHAEASMHRLHMHVISDDMNSPCLKNKKHWNTFTTAFFLNAKSVHEDLEKNGKITIIPSSDKLKEFMNTPLKCNKCDFVPKNLPKLKEHLLTHLN